MGHSLRHRPNTIDCRPKTVDKLWWATDGNGRGNGGGGNEELDRQEDAEREEVQGYDKDLTADEKEEKGEKGDHNFLRRGTTYIFDVLVTDLDAARHRGPPTAKVLERGGKKRTKLSGEVLGQEA